MRRLVFVEAGCLVDTWSMAKELVRSGARNADPALRVLDAEAARGTDLRSVHRALWGLLDGCAYRTLAELPAVRASGCVDRADPLGRTARQMLLGHRAAGDAVVVVSDLLPLFATALAEHLGVHRVVSGAPPVDPDGRLTGGFPGILLGPAAGRAAERVAREEAADPACGVAYGRDPRDRDLLRAVGHGVRIDYAGHLHPSSGRPAGIPGLAPGAPASAADPRDRAAG